jgi:hypothetical protein
MAEQLGTPEIVERNSEARPMWLTIVFGILAFLIYGLDIFLGWNLIPKEHGAYVILAGIVSIAGPAVANLIGRPLKHGAFAKRELAAALLKSAEAALSKAPDEKKPEAVPAQPE